MSEKEYVLVGRMQLKTRDYIHQLQHENRELKQEIERLNNIIKEKDKDFELLRKAQLKKCQEYENLEKLNNANYQSFIEVNNIINKVIADIEDVRDKNNYYDDYKVDNSILTYWIDLLKGSDKE